MVNARGAVLFDHLVGELARSVSGTVMRSALAVFQVDHQIEPGPPLRWEASRLRALRSYPRAGRSPKQVVIFRRERQARAAASPPAPSARRAVFPACSASARRLAQAAY